MHQSQCLIRCPEGTFPRHSNRLGLTLMCLGITRGGGGVLPYMGYIGMCGPKGYGFSAVLVINRVLIIAILPPLW